jgi:hypothetical protein
MSASDTITLLLERGLFLGVVEIHRRAPLRQVLGRPPKILIGGIHALGLRMLHLEPLLDHAGEGPVLGLLQTAPELGAAVLLLETLEFRLHLRLEFGEHDDFLVDDGDDPVREIRRIGSQRTEGGGQGQARQKAGVQQQAPNVGERVMPWNHGRNR